MSLQVRDSHQMMEFTEDKIALIKQTIAKGCTNDELELFMHSCKRLGLDPISKQIYAIKRGNVMTIQTSIDGYRLIADRSGKYMPGREPTYAYDNTGRLVSATSYVKKMGPDGTWHEVASTAFMAEYDGGVNLWKKMPHVMLAKCAETAALRRAFPAEMSGIYTDEEMSQADAHVDKRTGEVKAIEIVEYVTQEQEETIERLIGDDDEYTSRILGHYKIDDFSKLPVNQFPLVMKKVKERNEQKLKEEMSNRVETA